MPFVKDITNSGAGAWLGQPKKIGQYTQVVDVRRNRRTIDLESVEPFYFQQPAEGVKYDLLAGYDPDIDWTIRDSPDIYEDDEDWSRNEPTNQVFQWILANRDELVNSDGSPVEFFATGSELANLMVIPNKKQKSWSVLATKFHETIFLKINEESSTYAPDPELRNKFAFSGNQFQRFLLSTQEDRAPNPVTGDQDLTILKRFKGVIKSSVENRSGPNRGHSHSFILPRDLDGVVPGYKCAEESIDRFVEIRSVGANKKLKPAFERYDLQKWWAKAHLAGVQKIFCGYRTEDFKIVKTETYVTEDIPRRCQKYWSKDDNISFFDGFLSLIKSQVIVNSPRVVYEFKFNPINMSIEPQRRNSTSRMTVVPDWFVKEFE